MSNNFSDLSVIVVTYKTDLKILEKCLSSIDPSIKVFIIENSPKFINTDQIVNNYKNDTIIYLSLSFNLYFPSNINDIIHHTPNHIGANNVY